MEDLIYNHIDEPINLKLAITYKDHEWNKVTEIEDRIHIWKQKNQYSKRE